MSPGPHDYLSPDPRDYLSLSPHDQPYIGYCEHLSLSITINCLKKTSHEFKKKQIFKGKHIKVIFLCKETLTL